MGQLAQKPLVLSMMLCDQFYRDSASGKLSLLGCFTSISGPTFPSRHPDCGVYLLITDYVGPITLTVRVVDRDETRLPIALAEGSGTSADPRNILDFPMRLPSMMFPSPGEYRVQAFCNGEFLIERRLHVFLRNPKPQG